MPDLHVDIVFSGIWQMTSTVILSGRSCLVVDPGYFPRELADIAARIPKRATVEALFFTHSHWDHVVGHGIFPAVPVYTSSVLARSVAEGGELAVKGMARAREFDSQWYVERPWDYTWPKDLRGLDDGGWFNVGDLDIETFLIPGHAPDCMAIRAENHLLVGDYLSPCEIPFVDDLADYRRTLKRLLTLISPEIDTVTPGHGPVLSAADACRIASEDLRYLDRIARCAEREDSAAALNLDLPRAAEVAGMRDHHTDNCRKAGLVTAETLGG
ncbi:MAG: MBL fold metallo-hydrolase [Deltaproteobacteria bacterium]|nr:MBL fold metallo-hydrolase [Deltaproteobacteria bacterium]